MVFTAQPIITFSVIVPLYNKRNYIADAVESVLRQTRGDFELIIVDDGSSDESASIVNDQFHDHRIHLLTQKNMGVAAARNTGISESTGTFVCFLDADDIWAPTKLEEIAYLFSLYPSAQFAGTSYFEFSESNKAPLEKPALRPSGQTAHELVDDFYARWTKYPFIFTSSIAVRSETLLRYGLRFPVGESLGEDQDLWFRLCELSPLAFSYKKLVGYRRGLQNNLSCKQPAAILPAYVRLKSRIDSHRIMGLTAQQAEELLRKHNRDIAIENARRGRRLSAIEFVSPSDLLHFKFIITLLMELVSPGIISRIKRCYPTGTTTHSQLKDKLTNHLD